MKQIIHQFSLNLDYATLYDAVYPLLCFYFLFLIVSNIIERSQQYIFKLHFIPRIKKEIIVENFSYVIDQSKSFFQKHLCGELAERIDFLSDNVTDLIIWFFEKILTHILSISISIIALLYFNFTCGLIILGWVLIFLLVSIIYSKKISLIAKEWTNTNTKLHGIFVDTFSNFLLVKFFNNKKYEEKNIFNQATLIEEKEKKMEWLFIVVWIIYSTSFLIVQVTSIIILLSQYKKNIINGSDFAFVWLMNNSIVNLLWKFLKDFVEFPKYYSVIKESLLILKQDIQIKNLPHAKKLIVKQGKIEFESVSFNFKNKPIFKKLSITINPKEKVGFVGSSGTGKSTFINLLLRLYDVEKGAIKIDNQDIREVSLESLYKNINIVPQEGNLFCRSIADNIGYGNPEYTEEELNESIHLSYLDKFINSLPKKKNTKVGERASLISGGQKQRIAFARSCLKKSKILILDEPTSNLDNITERLLQESLSTIMADKTVIIVAHRLSTIKRMDRIIVFDKHTVVQEGTHEELITQPGLYKKLWDNENKKIRQ
jgi:ATP-binding cassette subfamily B protein